MAKKQRLVSEDVKITTEEFRVSFPSVFEASSVEPGGKKKFGVSMLFQVKETAKSKAEGRKVVSIQKLKDAVVAVVTEKFGPDRSKWPQFGDGPGLLKLPFREGTEPGKKDTEGYGEGIIFVAASSINKPGIVYAHEDPVTKRPAVLQAPSDFYAGCYARAVINPYYWEYMGKKGVSFGLQNLQKLRDGEPFGGRGNAANDFDAIEAPAGAPAGVAAQAAPLSDIGI